MVISVTVTVNLNHTGVYFAVTAEVTLQMLAVKTGFKTQHAAMIYEPISVNWTLPPRVVALMTYHARRDLFYLFKKFTIAYSDEPRQLAYYDNCKIPRHIKCYE